MSGVSRLTLDLAMGQQSTLRKVGSFLYHAEPVSWSVEVRRRLFFQHCSGLMSLQRSGATLVTVDLSKGGFFPSSLLSLSPSLLFPFPPSFSFFHSVSPSPLLLSSPTFLPLSPSFPLSHPVFFLCWICALFSLPALSPQMTPNHY